MGGHEKITRDVHKITESKEMCIQVSSTGSAKPLLVIFEVRFAEKYGQKLREDPEFGKYGCIRLGKRDVVKIWCQGGR